MRTSAWILLAAVVGAGALLLLRRSSPPNPPVIVAHPTDVVPAPPASGRGEPVAARGAAGVPGVGPPAASRPGDVDLPEAGTAPAAVVRVRANQALATVNGKAIELKDLVPVEPGETERPMTQEEWQSRLDRAIEVELTFQAASAQGVELTSDQKQRLEGLARHRDATLKEFKLQGITWSSATPAQAEFGKRLASALLLQQNMVARETPSAPSPDPAAQARYEQARRELLGRLRAAGEVRVSP